MDLMKQCRKCGGEGYLAQKDDLWYARCSKCTKWSPFEFLGITQLAAIRNWNEGNTPNVSNMPRKIDKSNL